MTLLAPGDQQKLREAFDEMTRPVRLRFFTQTFDCETCTQTRQILDELPPLSSKISIDEVNVVLDKDAAAQQGIDRAPAILDPHAGRFRSMGRFAHAFSRCSVGVRIRVAGAGRAARRWPGIASDRSRASAARVSRPADHDAGVHNANVTALPAGGQPRARNGVCESSHHSRGRRGD